MCELECIRMRFQFQNQQAQWKADFERKDIEGLGRRYICRTCRKQCSETTALQHWRQTRDQPCQPSVPPPVAPSSPKRARLGSSVHDSSSSDDDFEAEQPAALVASAAARPMASPWPAAAGQVASSVASHQRDHTPELQLEPGNDPGSSAYTAAVEQALFDSDLPAPQHSPPPPPQQHPQHADVEGGTCIDWSSLQPPGGAAQHVDIQVDLEDEDQRMLDAYTDVVKAAADLFVDDSHKQWAAVADLDVCCDHPGYTVRHAAFNIVHVISTTGCSFDAAIKLTWGTAYGLLAHKGLPLPNNPGNRMPHSMAACLAVLDCPDISKYIVYLCGSAIECFHRWYSTLSNPEEHLRHCEGCDQCRCPLCKEPRFVRVDGKLQEGLMLYFFHDALQQFFLDADWHAAMAAERRDRSSDWYQTPECKRLMQWLSSHGIPLELVRQQPPTLAMQAAIGACALSSVMMGYIFEGHDTSASNAVPRMKEFHNTEFVQVVFFELGADGVELRRFTPHSCQLFAIRCRTISAEFLCKKMNTRIVAAVPGPVQPKAWQWVSLFGLAATLFDVKMQQANPRRGSLPDCTS